VKVDPNDLIGR